MFCPFHPEKLEIFFLFPHLWSTFQQQHIHTHTQNVIEPKMGKSFVYFDEFVFVLIVFRCFRSQLIIIETFLCIAATQITIRNFRNWPRLAALRVGCSFSTDFTLVFVRTVNTTLWHWLLSQNVRKIVKCILHRMDWIQFNWKTLN